jgi:guanine deaminase
MTPFVLKGNYLWSTAPTALELRPEAFGVCDENGCCAGVFDTLPTQYAGLPVVDAGQSLVVPGYSDLHVHAAQYRNMGLGMDLTLLDWLGSLAYPEEARFAQADYAREVYGLFARDLRAGLTTRAAIFASAHREGTKILMDCLEQTGLKTLVGRVNMNRNAPDYIREPDEATALAETERWLAETVEAYRNTKPIVTPRFVPSCTDGLLKGLGQLKARFGVPAQSHLDETPEEVAWVKELCPDSASYAQVYAQAGLLGPDVLMAHCLYLTEPEMDLLQTTGTFIAHCPCSNANVRSGIAPIRRYLDRGMHIGLGSDISGGHSLDMADTVRETLSASRLLWRLGEEHLPHLTAREAFYLATAGGGAFFGRVGQFQPGYAFDAVVIDDSPWRGPGDDLEARFQKMIYSVHTGNVTAKFVGGQRLF